MLDGIVKAQLAPMMNGWAARILQSGLTANKLTLIGFVFGLAACFSVGMAVYPLALLMIILNRFFDGLAGAVARASAITPLGSYIDILCDFIIYGAFPLFFALGLDAGYLAATFVLLSYLVMAVAYLGQTTFMARADALETPRGGLVENGEMIVFMVACCLFPPAFPPVAAIFCLLCWTTALIRVAITVKTFKA